jgi:membrane protein CcdC involved in cytochrome C biogenesis
MHISPLTSAVTSIFGAVAVLIWRVREGQTPVTLRKILIPPAGMATGFCMFIVPLFRIPWTWALASFLIGAVILAWPLLRTSRLHREGGVIMMKRSPAFLIVIIVLAAVRFAARGYFNTIMSIEQTGGLFFILAFGMILRWRMSMYFEYRTLTARPQPQPIEMPVVRLPLDPRPESLPPASSELD